jgi:lipopolysaccharide exporter
MKKQPNVIQNFSKKISSGVFWITISSFSARILNTISAIILARVLLPEDFGLMAISLSIISFSLGTTQTGFDSALIQKKHSAVELLNTAWTIELLRNIIVFLIIFILAPYLASFFNEPRAVLVLRVLSLSIIFYGFRNIGVVYFRKNLDFKKQFFLEIIPLITYISLVIPLSLILENVWALVFAHIANNICLLLISYFIHPYRPSIELDISKAKELFNFGKWILGSSIIVMIREQGLTMFIGKYFGIPILGFYNRANAFSTMLFQQISEVFWKVGYPAFSHIQDDFVRLRLAFLKTLKLLVFVGFPVAGGFFIINEEFIRLFLTEKWMFISSLIEIMCLISALSFTNTPASIVFQSIGKPSISTKISLLSIVIIILSIYSFSTIWGIEGALLSILVSVIITSPINWYLAIKLTGCSIIDFFKAIVLPLINTGVMMVVVHLFKQYMGISINFLDFFMLILTGVISYSVLAYLFDSIFNYGMYNLFKERINGLR